MADNIVVSNKDCNALEYVSSENAYYSKKDIILRVASTAALNNYPFTSIICQPIAFVTDPLAGGFFFLDDGNDDDQGTTFSSALANKVWRRVIPTNTPWNPLWWGAIGDGVTDDSSSIQTMLDLVDDEGEYFVKFPSGHVFYIENHLTITPGRTGVRNIRIEGYGATILANAPDSNPSGVLQCGTPSNNPPEDHISYFQICGLTFKSGAIDKEGYSPLYIEWGESYFGRISDCTFYDAGTAIKSGIMLKGIVENCSVYNFYQRAFWFLKSSNALTIRNYYLRGPDYDADPKDPLESYIRVDKSGGVQLYNGLLEGSGVPEQAVYYLRSEGNSHMKSLTISETKINLDPPSESGIVLIYPEVWNAGNLNIEMFSNKIVGSTVLLLLKDPDPIRDNKIGIIRMVAQTRMPDDSIFFMDSPNQAIADYIIFEDSISRNAGVGTLDYPIATSPILWPNQVPAINKRQVRKN